MNIRLSKKLKLAFSAILFLMFSCSEDENPPLDPEPKIGVVEEQFIVNAAFEDIDLLTIDILQSSGLGLRTLTEADICANTTVTHDESAKKITIDFGAGCTSPRGIARKGTIILAYSGANFLFPGTTITTTLDEYEVNGIKIEGTRTITNGGIDLVNSKATLHVRVENGKLTWPDNTSADYSSTQVRVLTLKEDGYESSITGTAQGKSREGYDYTAIVTDALILNTECTKTGVFIPSKGKMDFTVLGIVMSADLGEGSCDKIATVSYPGGSKELTLN
jgi:hypothetical protein